MSLDIKFYKICGREFLMKLLQRDYCTKKECNCCIFQKIVEQKLKESVFFSYNRSVMLGELKE